MENSIGVPWKTKKKKKKERKIVFPCDPAITLLGIYQKTKQNKNPCNSERHMHPNVDSMLFTVQDMEET